MRKPPNSLRGLLARSNSVDPDWARTGHPFAHAARLELGLAKRVTTAEWERCQGWSFLPAPGSTESDSPLLRAIAEAISHVSAKEILNELDVRFDREIEPVLVQTSPGLRWRVLQDLLFVDWPLPPVFAERGWEVIWSLRDGMRRSDWGCLPDILSDHFQHVEAIDLPREIAMELRLATELDLLDISVWARDRRHGMHDVLMV